MRVGCGDPAGTPSCRGQATFFTASFAPWAASSTPHCARSRACSPPRETGAAHHTRWWQPSTCRRRSPRVSSPPHSTAHQVRPSVSHRSASGGSPLSSIRLMQTWSDAMGRVPVSTPPGPASTRVERRVEHEPALWQLVMPPHDVAMPCPGHTAWRVVAHRLARTPPGALSDIRLSRTRWRSA